MGIDSDYKQFKLSIGLIYPVSALQVTTKYSASAQRAIDGNKNNIWNGRSCTHTLGGTNTWWAAFMGMHMDNFYKKIWQLTRVPKRDPKRSASF